MYIVVAESEKMKIGYNRGHQPRLYNKRFDKLIIPGDGLDCIIGDVIYELNNSRWVIKDGN